MQKFAGTAVWSPRNFWPLNDKPPRLQGALRQKRPGKGSKMAQQLKQAKVPAKNGRNRGWSLKPFKRTSPKTLKSPVLNHQISCFWAWLRNIIGTSPAKAEVLGIWHMILQEGWISQPPLCQTDSWVDGPGAEGGWGSRCRGRAKCGGGGGDTLPRSFGWHVACRKSSLCLDRLVQFETYLWFMINVMHSKKKIYQYDRARWSKLFMIYTHTSDDRWFKSLWLLWFQRFVSPWHVRLGLIHAQEEDGKDEAEEEAPSSDGNMDSRTGSFSMLFLSFSFQAATID